MSTEQKGKHQLQIKDIYNISGIATGWNKFDEITSSLQKKDLIIVASRPSMGKTAFALSLSMRTSMLSNCPVLYFSLELTKEQIIKRILSIYSNVHLKKIINREANNEEYEQLQRSTKIINETSFFIDDSPEVTVEEIRSRAINLVADKQISIIMIDYIQLIRGSKKIKHESRESEIAYISMSLKALAKELNLPIVILSQLHRKVEEKNNKRPVLSDFRESGIEQEADLIIFLYREKYYSKESDNSNIEKAEIIIGKNRNGPTGTIYLAYHNKCCLFKNSQY